MTTPQTPPSSSPPAGRTRSPGLTRASTQAQPPRSGPASGPRYLQGTQNRDEPRDPRLQGTLIRSSVLDGIGQTPLVRLKRLSDALGIAPLLVLKSEDANPGGTAKTRTALAMINAAEAAGQLRPGSTIVEPTSGNTGVGLAIVAAQRGYACVFVVTDQVAPEHLDVLRAYGAEIITCPADVPEDDPESLHSVVARVARQRNGFRPNPYDNPGNPAAHEQSTGPEIWEQTAGRITHFVSGVGTAGTITGVARFLKAHNPNVRIIAATPEGSAYAGGAGRPSLLQGLNEEMFPVWAPPRDKLPVPGTPVQGGPRLPAAWEPDVVDEILTITDEESFATARQLAAVEGILVGGSGGLALAAALRVARSAAPDDLVVVLNPDSGRADLPRIFNDRWMAEHGFLGQADQSVGRILAERLEVDRAKPALIYVNPEQSVRGAIELMRAHAVSQLPVCRNEPPFAHSEVIGAVDELALMEGVLRAPSVLDAPVASVIGPPLPTVGAGQPIIHALELLRTSPALLVLAAGRPTGIITRSDVLAALGAATPVPGTGTT